MNWLMAMFQNAADRLGISTFNLLIFFFLLVLAIILAGYVTDCHRKVK